MQYEVMMEKPETAEVLDDLRKKRLAYFQTSSKQSSQENVFSVQSTNIDCSSGVPSENHHSKEVNYLHNEESKETAGTRYFELERSKTNDSGERLLTNLDEKKQHNEDSNYRTLQNDGRPENQIERSTKTSKQEEEKSPLKTSEFYLKTEKVVKNHDSTGMQDQFHDQLVATDQLHHVGHETVGLTNGNVNASETKDTKHVHYEDGYNETVERLIKATKDELLGHKVQDDIWSGFRAQQKGYNHHNSEEGHKFQDSSKQQKIDQEHTLQKIPLNSTQDQRKHSIQDYTAQTTQHSENIDEMFHGAVNLQIGNVSREHGSNKLEKSQDFSELGLSTHRPGSGKLEDTIPVETHGVKLHESLSNELRHALGEEKFKEFIEKSKKDIDVLQQERYSARSEKESRLDERRISASKQREKENMQSTEVEQTSSLAKEEKRSATTNKSEDFTPRNDGDAVHNLIGEHILKKTDQRQKLTSNPAYKKKTTETNEKFDPHNQEIISQRKVPELNLTSVSDSPRPMLNRPKHEPHNIYQDRSNKQASKKPEITDRVEETAQVSAKNYEQVTVSRNIVFSADEIYFQAYGRYPGSRDESTGMPGNKQATPTSMDIRSAGIPLAPHGIPLNNQGIHISPKEMPMANHGIPVTPHEMPMTPHTLTFMPYELQMNTHGIPVTPHGFQNAALINTQTVPMSPHYHDGFNQPGNGVTSVSVAMSIANSMANSQNYYNVSFTPQSKTTQVGSMIEQRGLGAYTPVVSQNIKVSDSIQIPHPPTQPPTSSPQIHQHPASMMGFGTSMGPRFVTPGVITEQLPTHLPHPTPPDLKGFSLQPGVPQPGYPYMYPYSYPVMVMTPHPPAEPSPPAQGQEKIPINDVSVAVDRAEEETTFTSVSQIPPPVEEIKVPRPPETKKEAKRRSPRKMAVSENTAKRHIDGIRHHHEQRRQQQEEERLSEAQVIEKQRKFAKASIERYFQSLENLYKPPSTPNTYDNSEESPDSSDEYQPPDGELSEIQEIDAAQDELIHNEKLNEIFKTTNPNNFDVIKTDKANAVNGAVFKNIIQTEIELAARNNEKSKAALASDHSNEPLPENKIKEIALDRNLKSSQSKHNNDDITANETIMVQSNDVEKSQVSKIRSDEFKDIDFTDVSKPSVQAKSVRETQIQTAVVEVGAKYKAITPDNKSVLQTNLTGIANDSSVDTNEKSILNHNATTKDSNITDTFLENGQANTSKCDGIHLGKEDLDISHTKMLNRNVQSADLNAVLLVNELGVCNSNIKAEDTFCDKTSVTEPNFQNHCNSIVKNTYPALLDASASLDAIKNTSKPAVQSKSSITETNLHTADLNHVETATYIVDEPNVKGSLLKENQDIVDENKNKYSISRHDDILARSKDLQNNEGQEKIPFKNMKEVDFAHKSGRLSKPELEDSSLKTTQEIIETTKSKSSDLKTVNKPNIQPDLNEHTSSEKNIGSLLQSKDINHNTAAVRTTDFSSLLEDTQLNGMDAVKTISHDNNDIQVRSLALQGKLSKYVDESLHETKVKTLPMKENSVVKDTFIVSNQVNDCQKIDGLNLETKSSISAYKHGADNEKIVKTVQDHNLDSKLQLHASDKECDAALLKSKAVIGPGFIEKSQEQLNANFESKVIKHDSKSSGNQDVKNNFIQKTQDKMADKYSKSSDLKSDKSKTFDKPDLINSDSKEETKNVSWKLDNAVHDVISNRDQNTKIRKKQEITVLEQNSDIDKVGIEDSSKEKLKVENVGSKLKSKRPKYDIVYKNAVQDGNSDYDGETLVNSCVTGLSIDAGGLTERLDELGIDSTHLKTEKGRSNNALQSEAKDKKGKLLIICPECEGFNKEYMSWCTHCGEMIIGVEPMLVSKNRQGKIRKKPATMKAEKNGDQLSISERDTMNAGKSIVESTGNVVLADASEHLEKPLTLDLDMIKSSKDLSDAKLNVSPNKSDGKDSGRPSSDDQDMLQNLNNRIEQEVEDDICRTITDPIVKGYIKSHFAKRRQGSVEQTSSSGDETMKSKVQSWIEEVSANNSVPVSQTLESHNAQSEEGLKLQPHSISSDKTHKPKLTAQNVTIGGNNSHLKNVSCSNNFDVNTLSKKERENLHFENSSSPTTQDIDDLLVPPELPKFDANLSFDRNELALKLTTESMDFSQVGSVDFSNPGCVSTVLVTDAAAKEENKTTAKRERRRKKGHGAIDVEIFGYEESRECKNSSRGQKLVPILNLPLGSSDEEDMSVQSDSFDSKFESLNADYNHAVIGDNGVNHSLASTAWQSGDRYVDHSLNRTVEQTDKSRVPPLVRPEEFSDDWQLLFDPSQANNDQEETCRQDEEDEPTGRDEQPFLLQLISQKGAKSKRPKSSKGKPVKSKVRQSVEAPSYQRKWARSSTAWSSYNPGELKTSSSLRLSTDGPGPSSERDSTASRGNLSERSVSPVRPTGHKHRPTSADMYKRKQQKQRPASAGVKKSRDRSHGNKDMADEKMYNLVEHRLPRKGIQEMLQDRVGSPRSTYDKYLEMTPRIHEGTLSRWQCLPDEILLHIFAYLSQSDLTRCALVCHQFYRVAMDESLWKYITIKKKSDLDDSCLVEISRRHPVSLALIHCHGDQVTAIGLRDMFRECADCLKELNISRCSRGALNGDSILLHAAARCHNVTHIDTSWCNITDSGLMAISNCCNRLESLCVNGCQAISNDGLETVIKKHGQNLRVLEMFGCFNITPRGLQAVSNNCINLISLHLGQCYKLTDSSIAQLSSSLGRVETLDLRGCKQIKDNCIRRVVKNCTRLKQLSLANCPNITDVSILEIATYLTDIRSLDLCGCKNITDNSIRALVNTCTNLRHIDISSTSCTHRSVSMIANFCAQRLESLRINFLSDVTEASLIKLAKHCRRLTSVHLYGCSSVRNLDKVKEERPTFKIEM